MAATVQMVYDGEFTVLGEYDGAVVSTNSVKHCGRDQPIGWLNQYAFQFHWGEGNDQIWVYNVDKAGFHQICNKVDCGIIDEVRKRLTTQGRAPADTKATGKFETITVNDSTINHCGQTRGMTWINPKAFYFKWSEGNEQIWVFDENVDAYLQLHTADCVKGCLDHTSRTLHRI